MGEKFTDNKSEFKKLPPPPENHPARKQLYEEVVAYNATGNYLALWRALELYLEHEFPVPKELAAIFRQMAHRLVALSLDEIPKARDHVPDIVLGTNVVGGGDPVFRPYRLHLRDRARLKVVMDLVTEHVLEKPQPYDETLEVVTNDPSQEELRKKIRESLAKLPPVEIEYAWTLLRVYDEAAGQLRRTGDQVEPEVLKRLFEQYEKDSGPFKTNAVLAAARKPSSSDVVEVKQTARRGARKSKKD